MSAPPCSFVGSLVLVPLCSGCFPEGTRRKLNLPFVDGSAGSRAVGADGGKEQGEVVCGGMRVKARPAPLGPGGLGTLPLPALSHKPGPSVCGMKTSGPH